MATNISNKLNEMSNFNSRNNKNRNNKSTQKMSQDIMMVQPVHLLYNSDYSTPQKENKKGPNILNSNSCNPNNNSNSLNNLSNSNINLNNMYNNSNIPTPINTNLNNNNINNNTMNNMGNNNMVWIDPRVSTPIEVNNGYNINNMGNLNNQINAKLFNAPFYHNSRNNSNASLASSVNSDFGFFNNPDLFANNSTITSGLTSNFTPDFIKILMSTYQNVSIDPLITPFDTTNPPGGILNKVSKLAIETAVQKNIDIGYELSHHLVTMVRHKLLNEVRKDGYLSRNASTDFFNTLNASSGATISNGTNTTNTNGGGINFNNNTTLTSYSGSNSVLQPKYFTDLINNTINSSINGSSTPNGSGAGLLPVQEINSNNEFNKLNNKFPLQRNIIRSRSNTFDRLQQPSPNTLQQLQNISSGSSGSLNVTNNVHLLHLSRPNTSSPLSTKSSNNSIPTRTNSYTNNNISNNGNGNTYMNNNNKTNSLRF